MSEYWKSTPKYWCKFCSEYIKDTKIARQQHEATGRHQGSIQRSLRGLHREQEVQAREKQRAKDEVVRLNGVVSGGEADAVRTASQGATAARAAPLTSASLTYAKCDERRATLEDRRRQWEQLAAMGVAVPDEARGGMALKGEWSVVSERVIGEVGEHGSVERYGTGEDGKGGVKRKKTGEDEDEDEEDEIAMTMIMRNKSWGDRTKTMPGREEDDVEALFASATTKTKVENIETSEGAAMSVIKDEDIVKQEADQRSLKDVPTHEEATAVLRPGDDLVKEEDFAPAPPVMFKKRKKIVK